MVLGALGLWLILNVEIFHDEDCDPCIPVLVDFQVLKQQSEHGRRQGVSERRIVLKQFLAAAPLGYKYYDLLARSRPIISITAWKEAPDVWSL